MERSGTRHLVWLAVIGIVLYGGIAIISWLSGEKLEDETSKPPVGRAQAEETAVTFIRGMEKLGDGDQPQTAAVYQTNQPVSAYIAKQKLDKTYDKSFAAKVPLDYWEVRVTDGSVRYLVKVGLEQPIIGGWSEEKAGDPYLNGQRQVSGKQKDEAAPSAEEKLAAEKAVLAAGYSLNDFDYGGIAESGPGLQFTSKAAVLGEAKLQLLVNVQKGEVAGFQPGFRLPTSFQIWFDRQNRLAQWFSYGSLAGSFLMALAAVVFAIKNARRVTFGRGILLTLLFAAIYIAHTINGMPGELAAAGEGAGDSPIMNAIYLVFTIGFILLMAAAVYLSLVSGDQLWRERGWNPWPRWREAGYGEHVWKAMARGYLICLFVLGLQQLLFAIADQTFHSFSINDPSQSLLNMHRPALFPTLAWMAGISEEILFRLFAIVALRMLLRNTAAAVLVSAFLWALGHAAYAIYPSYTRLFEVTVLGIVFGYTFLRYGLITAIFAHATMDSILMALSLMFMGKPGDLLAGLFYIASPALVAGFILLLHRAFWRSPREGAPVLIDQ